MKIATYIGFLYLAWLTPNALADKVFELEEIRSGNDISNVRKIYPEAKVVYLFFKARTNIYFSVYEVEKGRKYLFIGSQGIIEEPSWIMRKNNRPFDNKNKTWMPHKVKVYNQIHTEQGSKVGLTGKQSHQEADEAFL